MILNDALTFTAALTERGHKWDILPVSFFPPRPDTPGDTPIQYRVVVRFGRGSYANFVSKERADEFLATGALPKPI